MAGSGTDRQATETRTQYAGVNELKFKEKEVPNACQLEPARSVAPPSRRAPSSNVNAC
jgi:hypothetical protein